jgi:ribosomal protein S18 acetylase RimI-like enzyme
MDKIRKLLRKDIIEVRALALKSWMHAYKEIYKEKTISRMISDYYSDKNFEKYFEAFDKGKSKFVVAIHNKVIVGYAQVVKNKRWEIVRIYVKPSKLNQGIGTKLMLNIESFLKKKGANSYTIYPHVKNKIAVNFYKKKDFIRKPKLDKGWNSPCYFKSIKP